MWMVCWQVFGFGRGYWAGSCGFVWMGDNVGMPEAPDLFLLREYLAPRIEGEVVDSVRVLRPLVVRNMVKRDLSEDIAGREIQRVKRSGKVIMISFSGTHSLVINPMLVGELKLVDSSDRLLKSTVLTVNLGGEKQLRYLDSKQMGQVYYVLSEDVGLLPMMVEQGPDVLDKPMSLRVFRSGLSRFRGEVKGVLTRGQLVSGIGNAYSDEILWGAGIYPFKKVTRLTEEEVARLRDAVYAVTGDAVDDLREVYGDGHPRKERGLLKIHGKTGDECPKCLSTISVVRARRGDTNFCRRCQPGSMFD